jgi:hypothetical protein
MEKMKTYWGNTGAHQGLSDQLQLMIPFEGAVESPRGRNRKLEKFRQASNAYYDIFNNGGGNRGPLIRRIFNISVGAFRTGRGRFLTTNWDGIHRVIEPIMDRIILEAAAEQGLIPADAIRGLELSGRCEVV